MKDFIQWIKKSFEAGGYGASARKLSAFIVMTIIVIAHVSWLRNSFMNDDYSLLSEILIIDFSFVATLLGLKTFEGLQKNKNGKINEVKDDAGSAG